jgi:ketosteroid isomerase-like protein
MNAAQPADPGTAGSAAEVLDAAQRLVTAFGSHDVAGYFGCFEPGASFVFHNNAGVIGSLADYQRLWQEWEQQGFRVLGCRSLQPRVQVVSADTAVFTHRVRTRLAGEDAELAERETIVFHRAPSGRWLGVHEHLSVDPEGSGSEL